MTQIEKIGKSHIFSKIVYFQKPSQKEMFTFVDFRSQNCSTYSMSKEGLEYSILIENETMDEKKPLQLVRFQRPNFFSIFGYIWKLNLYVFGIFYMFHSIDVYSRTLVKSLYLYES